MAAHPGLDGLSLTLPGSLPSERLDVLGGRLPAPVRTGGDGPAGGKLPDELGDGDGRGIGLLDRARDEPGVGDGVLQRLCREASQLYPGHRASEVRQRRQEGGHRAPG